MNTTTRWGAWLIASLPVSSAGCSAAPPQAPAAPPAALPGASPAAPPGAEPAVEPTQGDLAPFGPVVALPAASPAARLPSEAVLPGNRGSATAPTAWQTGERRVTYGRGAIVVRTFSAASPGGPRCPLAGFPAGCMTFALTPPTPLPDASAWLAGPPMKEPPASVELTFQIAPRSWRALAGGRDAVYALTSGEPFVDRIDERGRVTAFASGEELKAWQSFSVVELGERRWLLGQRHNDALVLAEALPGRDGARTLSAPVVLPINPMQGESAQAARRASDTTRKVMFGEPRFVSLPHEGKDRWAMVWLEIVPPAYGPHSAPRAKHGCGRASHGPSRRLDDPSIDKRAHVTRFDGSSLIEDSLAWTKNDIDVFHTHLEARLVGSQVTVEAAPNLDGRAEVRSVADWSLQGYTSPHKVLVASDEVLAGVAFDRGSREGLIVVWSEGYLHHRRFDAEGKFQGEAVKFPLALPRVALGEISLRRVAGRWYGLHRDTVLPLSGGTASVKLAPEDHPGVVPAESIELAGVEECPRVVLTGSAKLLACFRGGDAARPGVKVELRKIASP